MALTKKRKEAIAKFDAEKYYSLSNTWRETVQKNNFLEGVNRGLEEEIRVIKKRRVGGE